MRSLELTCPLSGFDAGAIEWTMPRELLELRGAIAASCSSGAAAAEPSSSSFNAERLWATLLSIATLQDFEESWLLEERGGASGMEATVVDLAWAWVRAQERAFPLLAEHTGRLLLQARDQIKNGWEKDHVRYHPQITEACCVVLTVCVRQAQRASFIILPSGARPDVRAAVLVVTLWWAPAARVDRSLPRRAQQGEPAARPGGHDADIRCASVDIRRRCTTR